MEIKSVHILSVLLLLCLALPSTADVITIVEVPYTETESDFKMEDLINCEVQADPENTIGAIVVKPHASTSGQGSVQLTFGNNTNLTYYAQINKSTWIIFTSYSLSHRLNAENYTIFHENKTGIMGLDSTFVTKVQNNELTGNNTFWIDKNILTLGQSVQANVLPSNTIRIQGDVPFDIEVHVINEEELAAREQERRDLNPILGFIADSADKILPEWAYDALMGLLTFINLILNIVSLVALAAYRYPYLVIVWYMTGLNVYVSFSTETFSDFIAKWSNGMIAGGQFALRMLIALGHVVVQLLKFLRQIFQL